MKWCSTLVKQTRNHRRMLKLSLDAPLSTETKREIPRLWFSDAVSGLL